MVCDGWNFETKLQTVMIKFCADLEILQKFTDTKALPFLWFSKFRQHIAPWHTAEQLTRNKVYFIKVLEVQKKCTPTHIHSSLGHSRLFQYGSKIFQQQLTFIKLYVRILVILKPFISPFLLFPSLHLLFALVSLLQNKPFPSMKFVYSFVSHNT